MPSGICARAAVAINLSIRHLQKLMHDPSPNLSPFRGEALIPSSLVGKGGRGVGGLGLRVNLRFLNLFWRCLLGKCANWLGLS